MLRLRALTRAAVASVAALALLAPTPALAEPATTAEAKADNGVFLGYTTPPVSRAGLCLIDTGVNLNPDTEKTVVLRTSIEGGTTTDTSPTTHGTILAMLAAAPLNNWGTIGVAPTAIQIISVRILAAGRTTFPFSSYAAAISVCLQLRKQYDIRVINLSLGTSETPSSQGYETVGDVIEEANDYGVAVVAAAGNDNGGPVGYPAAYPSVLSVGASDTQTGEFCSFSNRGSGLRLLAPGCDLDAADPSSGVADYNYWQGTSEASVIAAAALDALFAYQPTLSAQAGEEDLTSAQSGVLDIAGAFQKAGLGSLVSEGQAVEARQTATSEPPPTASSPIAAQMTAADPPRSMSTLPSMTLAHRLPRPRGRLQLRGSRVRLTLTSPPREALVEARYLGRGHSRGRLVLRTRQSSAASIVAPASHVIQVDVRYVDLQDRQRDSPWSIMRVSSDTQTRHPQLP